MIGVRWHEELEGRCNRCGEYWPLTREFWYPSCGMGRCRTCILEVRRNYTSTSAERRHAYYNAKRRHAEYVAKREHYLALSHAYRAAHRDQINKQQRERYHARRRAAQWAA